MPELTIRIKKGRDGAAALTLTRADGTVTWQKQTGAHAAFFPRHDLTHYAVETVLGHRRGFYGLVVEGWNLTDFGTPWPRGRLPLETDPSELIVGFFDTERAAGQQYTAADFNDKAAAYYAQHGIDGRLSLTDAQLDRVRERMLQLFAQWAGVPAGESLELGFDRA